MQGLTWCDSTLASIPWRGFPYQIGERVLCLGHPLNPKTDSYPRKIEGVQIDHQFKKIHFLHAASFGNIPSGTPVGDYVFHYADGEIEKFPIVQGENIQDFLVAGAG